MSKFTKYFSYKKLLDLQPLDLTKEGVLSESRVKQMQVKNGGIKLLFSTERICEKVLKGLKDLADEASAVDKMQRMQSGERINLIENYESENRAVLHTAMRDVFNEQTKTPQAEKAKQELEKLKSFLPEMDKFTDLIHIGIGGSDLGPRSLYLAMEKYLLKGKTVHFVSNVDPDDLASTFSKVDLSKTLVVVVSKSGTTLETKTNERMIRAAFEKENLESNKHCIAVTGEKSPMDDPTKYLQSFYIWDYVGGRYSSTSMVGAVTLSYAFGIDVFMDLLRGAHEMDLMSLEKDMDKNLPLMGALIGIWNHNFLNIPTLSIVPYSQGLLRFPAHLQQCEMESNGKSIDKEGRRVDFQTGPILWGEIGTNGQHSFFQLLHQGTQIAALEMVGFQESQYGMDMDVQNTTSQEKLLSNLFAQSIALATGKEDKNPNNRFEGNRPNHLILAKRLDPRTLGKLLAYYEHKIAFQGFIWDINSFDQQGVQYGKVLADKILSLYKAKKEGGKYDYPLGEAFIQELSSLD